MAKIPKETFKTETASAVTFLAETKQKRHSFAHYAQVLRKHDPERFAFLNPENEYNAFYRYKVRLITD